MQPTIKEKLKGLIDNIQDEAILTQIYELVYTKSHSKEGELWKKLTPEQQQEVLLSLEESNDPANLISHEEVKKKHKRWH